MLLVLIGGFDPACASGLARDILTAGALGRPGAPVFPVAVPTAWTEQDQGGVRALGARPTDDVRRGVHAALDQARAAASAGAGVALKVGMVAHAGTAAMLADVLRGFAHAVGAPIVVDPVLAASRGGVLYQGPLAALDPLFAAATLVTPNAPEAAALTDAPVLTRLQAEAAAATLAGRCGRAVLLKGGHLEPDDAGLVADLLVESPNASPRWLGGPRAAGPTPRGTGCALATAIAVGLGRGLTPPQAVLAARTWLGERIAAAGTDATGQRWLP